MAGTRWRGLLAPINKPTGDGRRIVPGGFTHRPLPLPLKWQRADSNGHDESVTIGVIDTLNIDEEAGEVYGEGELFDDVNPATTPQLAEDANHVRTLMEKKVVGPSVDPGSAQATAVMTGMDRAPTMREIQQFCDQNDGQMPPTEMLFTGYEIAGATLVPIPAFSEARPLELVAASALTASRVRSGSWDGKVAAILAAATLPPPDGSLFLDPELDQITPLTRHPLPSGWTRVFGHIATHDVCLVGQPGGVCTTAPFSDQDYQTFHRYHRTADGIELPLAAGRLTAAHGQLSATCRCCPGNDDHACNNIGLGAAVAHHDRMRVLAYGRAGEDERNNAIWFAGVEAPEVDERDVKLLNRRKVSGDWRETAGNMELVEILVLSRREPGFPLPRVSVENGRQRSLTAASPIGAIVEREDGGVDVVDTQQLGEALGHAFAGVLDEFGFNENQKRGPNGKWISMGGKGGAGGKGGGPKLPGRKAGASRDSEGGGTGAGGRNSGDSPEPSAPDTAEDVGDSVMTRKNAAHNQIVLEEARAVQVDNEDDPDNELEGQIEIAQEQTATHGPGSPEANAATEHLRQMLLISYLDEEDVPAFDPDEYPGITAAAQVHTGAMIALRMSEADAARLAATDGEPLDQLHLTLAYLGDADQIPPEVREQISAKMNQVAGSYKEPLAGDGFAIDVFNPGTVNKRDTAIVMGVGGQSMADIHAAVMAGLGEVDGLSMPDQHAPHVPHVTLQYTDDLNRVKALADRVGPVTFDRLRMAFGGEVTDIPIGAVVDGDDNDEDDQQTAAFASDAAGGKMCAKAGCGKDGTECASCTDCTPALFAQRGQTAALALRAALAATQLGCCKTAK